MKKKKIFVLDTNVPMHDPDCCSSFKEHDIDIPIHVLTELDNHKKGFDVVNYNTREFTRFLDGLDDKHLFNGGVSLGEGLGKIRVIVDSVYDPKVASIFPEKIMDHMIISCAYRLSIDPVNKDTEVVLVSKDVNLRMKAKSLGLKAEDYKTDSVIDVKSLCKTAKPLKVAKEIVDSLFKEKIIKFETKELIDPNEPVILNPGDKNTALAVYKDGSLTLIQKDKFSPFGIKPKNSEQAFAISALLDDSILLVSIVGPAGTGKTIISLASALAKLDEEIYKELLFTRTTISVGNKDIGFLPGDVNEKISPFMQGLFDNLGVIKEIDEKNRRKIDTWQQGEIKIEPISFIRGRSLVKKILIVDEAQNLTPQEVKTIVTRAGEGTKMVFIGDITQIDNPYLDERSNGLSYLMDKMKGQDFYSHLTLVKGERSLLAEVAGKLL